MILVNFFQHFLRLEDIRTNGENYKQNNEEKFLVIYLLEVLDVIYYTLGSSSKMIMYFPTFKFLISRKDCIIVIFD